MTNADTKHLEEVHVPSLSIDKALKDNPKLYPRELVEKCTAAAIDEIKACKLDPVIVKKLAALADNTWLK